MDNKISMKYLFEIEGLFDDIQKFKNFLTHSNEISFKDNTTLSFLFKDKTYTINYSIIRINQSNTNHFVCNVSSKNIDTISNFNRLLNKIISNTLICKILPLKDGISLYYSSIAYNQLHSIENSIRALLTEVMCFFGDPDWVNKDAKKILNLENKDSEDPNIFYSRNFDQLEKFLFTNYSEYTEEELLYNILDSDATNEELSNLINEIKNKLPVTIWNKHFREISKKLNIEEAQLQKLLKNFYIMRNRIAHCNKFHKNDFNKFEEDYKKLESIISNMVDLIEHDKLTSPIKFYEIEKSIDSKSKSIDTIVVPAKKDGFKDVFLEKSEWYDIRIRNDRLDNIKYIAAYQVRPISAITHYAEVKEIITSNNDPSKKRVIFKESAKELDNPIKLGKNPSLALQNIRYTSFERLQKSKNLKDLFEE